jgi:hypothetical protein
MVDLFKPSCRGGFFYSVVFSTTPSAFLLMVPEVRDSTKKNPPEETGGDVFNNNFREYGNEIFPVL